MANRRQVLAAAGAGALLPLFSGRALASNAYPHQPVRVVVPFPPGPTDTVARIATEKLPQLLGQPIVIDNRSGASGQIGGQLVARAPADGYTLLFATIHFSVAPSLYANLPYDFAKDFEPVCLAAEYPILICVNNDLPVHSVQELIDYAKAHPGKLSFASSGNGGGSHLAGELFKDRAGVDMLHVPYKGAGPAMVDLIGGQVQLMFSDLPTALPQVQGGKIRALAVAGASRSPLVPDLPAVAESGLSDYAADTWAGVVAPAGTPKDVIATLNRALQTALSEPDVVKRLALAGAEARPGSPEAFGEKIRSEIAKWGEVVRLANITVG